jgi:hypothetical protein
MNIRYCLNVIVLATLCVVAARAQVTITESDVNAAFNNVAWMGQHDTLSKSYNLGNSSDGQSFDFSDIVFYPGTGRRDTQNYYPATGHVALDKDSFPTATHCIYMTQVSSSSGYTITYRVVEYFDVNASGVYIVGLVFNVTTTPAPPPGFTYPADSTVIQRPSPGPILAVQLPFSSSGAMFTEYDTSRGIGQPSTSYATEYKRTIPAGSGTMKLPGGNVVSVVRYLEVDSITTYSAGQNPSLDYEQYIGFLATDGSQMKFHVQNAVTGGSTIPISYDMAVKYGTLGVTKRVDPLPAMFTLEQNYPNPFNPTTTIAFELAREEHVAVTVYDMLGRAVATLVNGNLTAGSHEVRFDGGELPSGVYICRVTAGGFSQTRSMVLLK